MNVLAYDSDCGPCRSFRIAVGALDVRRRMRFMDLREADEAGLLYGVPSKARYASFHLIDEHGRARSGADAIPELASLLPGGRATSLALGSNPILLRASRMAYDVLSRLHGAGACPSVTGPRRE